jgi:hypothetical protein
MNVEGLRAQHSVSTERPLRAPSVDSGGQPDPTVQNGAAANGAGSPEAPPSSRFGITYDAQLNHLFIELRDPSTGTVVKTPPEHVVRLFKELKESADREHADRSAARREQDVNQEPVRLLATA